MDDSSRQRLVEFARDAISKGYTSDQLMQMMFQNRVSEKEAQDILKFVQYSVSSEIPENIFVPKLIVLGGIGLMAAVYVIKIFMFQAPAASSNLLLKIINGFWPLVFPIAANIINFAKYRKSFARGLFISGVAIGLLVLLVIVLAMLGL